MSENSKRAEAFAKYHRERAGYGGASREFHERAASFLMDYEQHIATARAEGFAAARERAEGLALEEAKGWGDVAPRTTAANVANRIRHMQDERAGEGQG